MVDELSVLLNSAEEEILIVGDILRCFIEDAGRTRARAKLRSGHLEHGPMKYSADYFLLTAQSFMKKSISPYHG